MREKQVGIEEARGILGDLVDEVRLTGAQVTLTRYGKPAARLVPVSLDTDQPTDNGGHDVP